MVWRASAVVLVLAGVVIGLLWMFQRHLIYFPDRSPVPSAAAVLVGAQDIILQTSDGLALSAWFVLPTGTPRNGAVLLVPGNAGNRADRAELADELRRQGFAILLMDYRGYGGNPGTPSEAGLARDSDAAVAALTELGYPSERTIYFGESLGAAVVASLQQRHPPAGVVLRSPFTELADVGAHLYPWLPVRLLLRERFPVAQLMATSQVPAVVVYGDSDTVVPPTLSAGVAHSAGALVSEVVLSGADHNDPQMFGTEVVGAVVRLADHVGLPVA
ncbi:MAG: alpha/beta fold hydrolase [Candidatus Nanopelagicales bacterium]